jgi:hypothetical protein
VCSGFKSLVGLGGRNAVSVNDDLWMDLLADETLGLTKQLGG